nr:hypothetical protein [Tanacetum cinerariifolium]
MRTNMNGAWPNRTSFNKLAHSYANRPFQRTSAVRSQFRAPWVPTANRNFPPVSRKFSTVSRNFPTVNRKFPTANRKLSNGGIKFSTADMGKTGKAGSSQNNIDDKGYWDSGCSRHMTGNISYLSDYEPFDGGYVSFGQGGRKITGKGTIKTDNLGKFEEKGDEGYFIGYSMSRKAFRIFNKRTRRVEENLHVEFLENKAIKKGTKNATSQEVKKDVSSLRNIALPNWAHDALLESSSSKPQDNCSTEVPESSGNTNPTVSTSNHPADQMETLTVESPIPTFEDILGVTTNSDESNRVDANVSNMETTITASPTPTLRVHKDHPKSQIIGPVDTPIQTRNKSKAMGEQSFIATIHQKTDPALLRFCLFSCFLSQVKPKKISDALQDPSWASSSRAHTEEGVDYDEVFVPVARIEAIRLFLAYASFMRFTVYQMDVKSAFLYGTIDEEVYVMRPLGFQDPEFPTKVYKVEKAMYGLHQSPRAWYGTLSKYLLTTGFQRGTIDQTLLIRRQRGNFILVQVYVDDIIFGSSNPQLCREFEALMHEKFQMSAMGKLNFFLGLQVLHKENGIFLSQDKQLWPLQQLRQNMLQLLVAVEKFCGFKISCLVMGTSKYWGVLRILMISLRLIPLSEHNVDFHLIVDFVEASPLRYALTFKPTVYVSHIQQFWSTSRIETTEEGTKILATVDGILRTVIESSLRRNLKLQDEEGISSLPDTELFENLTLMGYNISPNQKNITTALVCLATNRTYNFSKMIFDGLVKNVNNKGEGSGTPTEPHHTPSLEAQHTSHTTHSSLTILSVTTAPILPFTSSDTPPIRQYTRRARIAQSSVLPPVADEPTSPLRDVSQGEACPTDSGFEVDQDRATIAKTTTLPHDSAPRELEISRLKVRVKLLEDREGLVGERSGDDAPIKGRNLDEGEAAAERVSDDTKEMATILTSIDAATILAAGVVDVPTGSGSIPTASPYVPTGSGSIPTTSPPADEVPTGNDVVLTASLVFANATVVTPYRRRKGKEIMVESETPKKKKVQEQIDAQVARDLEEQLAREDQRMSEQVARDAELERIHVEEKMQSMIDGLDRINETVAKYLQEYQQFASELPLERRIELISDLKQLEDFIPMGSKEEAERLKRKGLSLEQKIVKKLKTSEEVTEDAKSPDEVPEEKVKEMMQLVPIEEVKPTSDKEMELWVELKRLYEPDDEDQLWTHTQKFMHAPVEWKLYDMCGVHQVASKDKEIFMLVEKDYPLRKGLALVMICYKLQVENYSQIVNDLILKIYNIANCLMKKVATARRKEKSLPRGLHCWKSVP